VYVVEIRRDLEKGPVYPARSAPDLRSTRRRDPARIPTPPIDENTHFKNTHLAENEQKTPNTHFKNTHLVVYEQKTSKETNYSGD
jgi:hypothetical protein